MERPRFDRPKEQAHDLMLCCGVEMVKRVVLLLCVATALAFGAYLVTSGWTGRHDPERAAAKVAVPAEVGVMVVQPAEVPLPAEYAGRIAAYRDVEIRSLVSGILLKREYDEGSSVVQGQVLFRIDPATYEVALSHADAQLQQAKATARQAEDNYDRVAELFGRGVSTEKQRDEALASRDQARASIQLAEAEIKAARLNLGYTVVNSPVSGVTALQSPPTGTLIQAQQTLLTTISQLDPAYVNFSYTEEEGQTFRELNERRAKAITAADLTVDLQYGGGSSYTKPGKIDSAAQRVDPQTGTIQARAIFPNGEGTLLPGQFVRLRVRGVTLPDAIVIPSQAVSQGPQGPSVYVIGENNTAQVRQIRLGPELASGWVVQNGLKSGERVIVDGMIRVRPGAIVKPVPVSAEFLQTLAPTSAGKPAGTHQ
jgi:membrane fusion protein (multidrug efflux system)